MKNPLETIPMSAAAGLMALTRKNALSLITKFGSSWRLRQKFFFLSAEQDRLAER